ncbi:MAG: alpha/beta hydrolase [Pseudomonadota bacterium]
MNLITLQRSKVGGLPAIVSGHGRPIVLLHGVGLRAEAWSAQIEALCPDHHVVAPDIPGHGEAPRPAGPMVLRAYAGAMLPVLDSFEEPVLVVGHSMGALMALELAALAPSKVCGIAALNAVFERSPTAAQAVQLRAAQLDGVVPPDPTPTLDRWFGAGFSTERSACDAWLRAADPVGYKLAYTAFAHTSDPDRDALTRLKCPALFATGALEPNSTPDMSHQMARLSPQGRSLIVEGAAHMMPMTHARDVTAAIRALASRVWS